MTEHHDSESSKSPSESESLVTASDCIIMHQTDGPGGLMETLSISDSDSDPDATQTQPEMTSEVMSKAHHDSDSGSDYSDL